MRDNIEFQDPGKNLLVYFMEEIKRLRGRLRKKIFKMQVLIATPFKRILAYLYLDSQTTERTALKYT